MFKFILFFLLFSVSLFSQLPVSKEATFIITENGECLLLIDNHLYTLKSFSHSEKCRCMDYDYPTLVAEILPHTLTVPTENDANATK